jgi:hypothetical protein
MMARVQHMVFAAVLVCTLVVNLRGSDLFGRTEKIELAVLRAAKSGGLVFSGYETTGLADLHVLRFEAPRCSSLVQVTVLLVTLEGEDLIRNAPEQGRVRYIYTDRTWTEPNRFSMYLKRLELTALAVFGLTQYVPSWQLLRVESPIGCEAADAIDWQVVWDRDYLAAAQREKSATRELN